MFVLATLHCALSESDGSYLVAITTGNAVLLAGPVGRQDGGHNFFHSNANGFGQGY